MSVQDNQNLWDDEDVVDLVTPKCDSKLIPVVGQLFPTLEEAVEFYDDYADACGFETRLGTIKRCRRTGTIIHRYVLCNREGLKPKKQSAANGSSKKERQTVSIRVDCMARIVFRLVAGRGYKVLTFNEDHTHNMVPEGQRHLLNSNRNVSYVHQMLILTGMKANIGPTRTFRFFKELVGTYDKVGCTVKDFKNYGRDLRSFADGVDARILLDNFKNKQESCPGFKYSFDTFEDKTLKRLFWADECSIKNFKLFGDAVSFDATYRTNRYKLIFTPFTGKDNHGRCVTFGAALIANEDVESYSWVFNKFRECMGSEPNVLTTDQDPAMRKAVQNVLPNTSHRLCMWHILMKVAEKLPGQLKKDTELKNKLNEVVWSDYVEISVFEENWHRLMDEYGLGEIRWFSDMFAIRANWVPAYFREIKMSGLFRTTSMSESENSFFRRHFNSNADLVQFYMHYVSAMDAQRSTYDTITLADETGALDMCTELPMERHASTVYTNKIFKDEVQVEIVSAAATCLMSKMYTDGSMDFYDVDDTVEGTFKVSYRSNDDYFSCSCNLFIRKGLLCRHIFYVMRNLKMKRIPSKYISTRWSKLSRVGDSSRQHVKDVSSIGREVSGNQQFFLELCKSIGHVRGDDELKEQLFKDLEAITEKYSKLGLPIDSTSKQLLFEEYYGSAAPDEVDVLPPNIVHTKGSGCGGRRKSLAEKLAQQALKPKRKCRKCNRLVNHDSRNCPG
ncbi:protein FAR1-RELATED SEQUENCE 5-like [Salvia miltiorrhiza]|uniref:protein FAR1-RELATED SEQUENCE 5-like n=1 Tax=Salvia miltiorrhiza TaxID=226208 RepID=UPI0025AC3EEC|nr:protein FAR1-RELATED SEQUENCE 5-like [Salvia miltiorrhiza]